jgi:hypothetical protein
MSTTEEHDYVSAVFIRLLQPIADLCDRMLQLGCGEPNEVQTSPMENGYAISIVALAAFLLDGACGRARFVSGSDRNDVRQLIRSVISAVMIWPTKSRKYS